MDNRPILADLIMTLKPKNFGLYMHWPNIVTVRLCVYRDMCMSACVCMRV